MFSSILVKRVRRLSMSLLRAASSARLLLSKTKVSFRRVVLSVRGTASQIDSPESLQRTRLAAFQPGSEL